MCFIGVECSPYNDTEVILHPLQPMINKIGNDEVTIKIEVDDYDQENSTVTGWRNKIEHIFIKPDLNQLLI